MAEGDMGKDSTGKGDTGEGDTGGGNAGKCDMWEGGMGELRAGDANPGGLREIFVDNVPPGNGQLMTMPKDGNVSDMVSAAGTRRTRRALAQSFALGGGMLVPWDVYLPTPDARRYYGSAADYGDLFAFVRAHAPADSDSTGHTGSRSTSSRTRTHSD